MLKPRFNWNCSTKGCCVFVGGTADYDIYMSMCHERPYDPMVVFVAEQGEMFDFESQADMDEQIDKWEQTDTVPDKAVLTAQNFVHCFFPSIERIALDALAREEP